MEKFIKLSGIVEESIVDGVGIRFVMFTQGCEHDCKGCHNPKTHSLLGGMNVSYDEILDSIKSNPLISGVTFSGGEPFLQPARVLDLVKEIIKMDKNIWIYSGFTFEELVDKNNINYEVNLDILKKIDVLVDGRFEILQRDLTLPFRGSKNQRLIDCSETLKARKITLYNLNT